jgi:hypothetical protein
VIPADRLVEDSQYQNYLINTIGIQEERTRA